MPQAVRGAQGPGHRRRTASTDVPTLVERVAREAQKGDVLLVMSNGAFGGFIDKLLAALKARAGEG